MNLSQTSNPSTSNTTPFSNNQLSNTASPLQSISEFNYELLAANPNPQHCVLCQLDFHTLTEHYNHLSIHTISELPPTTAKDYLMPISTYLNPANNTESPRCPECGYASSSQETCLTHRAPYTDAKPYVNRQPDLSDQLSIHIISDTPNIDISDPSPFDSDGLDYRRNHLNNYCPVCVYTASPPGTVAVPCTLHAERKPPRGLPCVTEQLCCTICDLACLSLTELAAHERIHDRDFNPILGHSYSVGPKQEIIKFLSVNVCGLSAKTYHSLIMEQLENYDIVSLCETKLDDADNTYISEEFNEWGFSTFIKNRKNLTTWRSGGVLVAVKSRLSHLVCKIESPNDFMIVLKFDKRLLGFDKDIIFIAAYVPPYTSRYSSIDHFSKISNTILDYDIDDFYHLVVGDLNAHTRLVSDLVIFDETLLNYLDLDEETRARLEITYTMNILGLPIERSSVDQRLDIGSYGQALLEICKNHLLCIFNGRAGADRSIGKATTTDGSVIDYVIGSPFLLSKVKHFNVNDFDNLFSDKHCCLEWYFSSGNACHNTKNANKNQPQAATNSSVFWEPAKAPNFITNLDRASITYMVENFDNLSIKYISDNIKRIFISSANMSLSKFKTKTNKTGKFLSYSKKTRKITQEYRKAKLKNNRSKCSENKADLLAKSRACRKEMLKVRAISKKKVNQKLQNLKTKDPKQYWKILHNSKRENIEVPLNLFKDHFEKLAVELGLSDDNDMPPVADSIGNLDTSALNQHFSETEIRDFVKNLKNSKASGIDGILNEYIKYSLDIMLPLYLKLFNRILDTGELPEDWLTGLIIPIYKNKGSRDDANNYRGITLLSCLGKLFTSILNHRLTEFCEENLILQEIQAGFRKGYSTLDHVFVVKNLIDLYKLKKRKLFCCFVDYTKAFDTIWREALWHKLINYGIQGKILNVIKSLYAQVKSCVFLNGNRSDFFISARGVRQGENLSPLLFSLFVNDIEKEFTKLGCSHIKIDDNWDNFIKLLILMYADDTIILADSEVNLQLALNALKSYCETWKLEINCSKTKITIFSRSKINHDNFDFKYGNQTIETVDSYKYLGVILNYNGSFRLALDNLRSQASRAMFSLISKTRRLGLSIETQLDLFDKTILPIMLYGCEIWGFTDVSILEKLHLKYLKMILGVHTKTCNSMVYGELGRLPLDIVIKKRAIGFWARILVGKETKLTRLVYNQFRYMYVNNYLKSEWWEFINNTLDECNLSGI